MNLDEGGRSPRRCPSGHLQPQLSQRLALGLQLAALQKLLLGQQPLIQLINSLEALLDRGDHLLLKQANFLLAIGLLDPGAAQRQPPPQLQDPLDRLEAGFEQQERILFWFAERTYRILVCRAHLSGSSLQSAPIGATRQKGEAAESMAI